MQYNFKKLKNVGKLHTKVNDEIKARVNALVNKKCAKK